MSFSIDLKAVRRQVLKEMLEIADSDFDIITRHDDDPAEFSKSIIGDTGEIKTSDPYFVRRNNGTEPSVIKPKRAKALRFQESYRAKTKKLSISSNPGGSFGDFVFAKSVNHPGIDARLHDEAVATHLEEVAESIVCDAIQRAFS